MTSRSDQWKSSARTLDVNAHGTNGPPSRLIASASAPARGITPSTPRNSAPARMTPLLVDRLEAARLLCVSPGTIDNMRLRADLPSVKLLGRRLYDVDDLRRYIEARKTTTSSTPALAAVGVEENR